MATPLLNQNNGTDGGCFHQCYGWCGGEDFSSNMPTNHRLHHHQRNDTRQEMKSTEDFLASELGKLSVEERSGALDDLHCVGQDLQETPEMVENSLRELDRILIERNDSIYNIAASQNRAYVEDPNFRLRFLRAKLHDAEKAATQMIGFLTQKEIYFGREKLARDITLNDLDENDMKLLLSGRFHIQDGLDRKGRPVVYFLNHDLHLSDDSLMRVNYFVFFNLLSPLPSVQTKGIVVCYYDMSKPGEPVTLPSVSFVHRYLKCLITLAARPTGIHYCVKTIPGSLFANNFLLERVLRGLRRSARVRARVHYGSDIELQYKLSGHGLPIQNVPVDTNGNIRKDILNVWFHRYVATQLNQPFRNSLASQTTLSPVKEEKNPYEKDDELLLPSANPGNRDTSIQSTAVSGFSNTLLVEPTPKDVLLGRGRGLQAHPGNIRFREFLNRYQEEYNNTPRYKRIKTPKDLTRLFLEDGVRFLKTAQSGDGWVEVDFSEAEKKVKQLFRTRKKMKQKVS